MSPPARSLTLEGAVRVPATAFDQAGFRAWVTDADFPETVRAAWVDGEVFLEMSPESVESHNKPKLELTIGIGQRARDENLGEAYADGVLLTNVEAGLSTEPDLVFASWATLADRRLRLVPRAGRTDEFVELEGTPDLVVEVLSDSSVRKDLVQLREAYRRAGIAEYWIVDARGSDLRFEILRLEEGEYRLAAETGLPQPSIVLGATFRLERSKNPAGRWSYRLTWV